ncbi:hypothetical protein [Halomonas sp. BM-2019]|uniref:hypothetical protein n=1 Tax=Halomonas sp. BM-2019 TaxID=2811227 RepID=UPI001B3C3294|nr:MAG: hypothetical protein J5F18_01760 [Halomonas sp. BM-2019]
MFPHSVFDREASCATTRRAGILLVVLLALATLLLGGFAMAHVDKPDAWASDPGRLVATEAASVAAAAAAWREADPSCRHGHGEFALPQGMPRVDRQEVECDDVLTLTAEPVTAPLLVPIVRTPRHRPAQSGLPVYLLTQRLRL